MVLQLNSIEGRCNTIHNLWIGVAPFLEASSYVFPIPYKTFKEIYNFSFFWEQCHARTQPPPTQRKKCQIWCALLKNSQFWHLSQNCDFFCQNIRNIPHFPYPAQWRGEKQHGGLKGDVQDYNTILPKTMPRLSTGCMCYCSSVRFTLMKQKCNTTPNL